MPPALPEDSSDSESSIAPKALPKAAQNGEEDNEEEEDEDEEEVYEPQAIRSHDWAENGVLLFEVKWKGYGEKDNTWEPEEHLDEAMELLEQYFKKIGGRPTKGDKGKKKKRKGEEEASTPQGGKGRRGKKAKTEDAEDEDDEDEASTKKKGRKGEWTPPMGSWENDVNSIESIEEHPDKDGEIKRWAYVLWNNGRQTRHELRAMNVKAPQKMLQFYEQHLHFKSADSRPSNGTTAMKADQEAVLTEAALQEDAAAED